MRLVAGTLFTALLRHPCLCVTEIPLESELRRGRLGAGSYAERSAKGKIIGKCPLDNGPSAPPFCEGVSAAVFSGGSTGSRLGYAGLSLFSSFRLLVCPSLGRNHCYLLHISRTQAAYCKLYIQYLDCEDNTSFIFQT